MTRNIIAIDLDSCIGCHSCAVVCKQENNVGLGTYYNKVLTVGPFGTNPECVSVCPTGASYRREDGVVLVDHSKCIGCQYCVMACPYGVRAYDEGKDKGVIEKCTMCAHLIDKGEKPACVKHCPGQARLFGDADDPESDVSKMIARKSTHKLKDVGNHPGVTYGLDQFSWKGDE